MIEGGLVDGQFDAFQCFCYHNGIRREWSMGEQELTDFILSREYRIACERASRMMAYSLNPDKILQHIRDYRRSKELAGPKRYYDNQRGNGKSSFCRRNIVTSFYQRTTGHIYFGRFN
ncbi:MAG: hypothetical protein J6B85_05650 [Lachnospiraceae bacterium]|nr:hypothetical protein [Lachnospiraceae bacterium]